MDAGTPPVTVTLLPSTSCPRQPGTGKAGSPGELDSARVRESPPKKAQGPSTPARALPASVTLPWAPPGHGGPGRTCLSQPRSSISQQCPVPAAGSARALGPRSEPPPPARRSPHLLWADPQQPGREHKAIPSPGSQTPSSHNPTLTRVPLTPSPSPLSTEFFFKPTPFSSNSEVSGLFLQRIG